ncbi:protein FAR1-RELATED SEQUENCE 5-like [Lotus japonicus]|uniref:protein FAR1-RELATED SEQUENCE 5-like n=1 Tax=Lotus japonicus TaxID=34305 RepID=UPI0025857D5A|nr:protein FAR1-RELATED SEQUENCE 5-like [Lotus japonicus]
MSGQVSDTIGLQDFRMESGSFVEDHNHELTPSIYSHVIPAYRTLSESDRAQVDSLHSSSIRTCHIMGFIMVQKGGYSIVGFLKEDLYNYINRQKHYKLRGEDARAAISYLRGKEDNDAMFYSKYTTTKDVSNKHLKSVVTDGDGAIREAIKQVFPSASHRLCAWNLHKNAKDNVKNKSFLTGFAKAMYSDFTIEEFEEYWNNLVVEHNLVGILE